MLGTRKLLHPHVKDKPFIRTLCCIRLPAGLKEVVIQAHGKLHGTTKMTRTVTLPR